MMPSAQPSRRNLFVAAAGGAVGCGRTRRRPGRLTYLPFYSDAWLYLCKPCVKRLVGYPFHGRMFNDAWIDTNWRPQ